MIREGTIADVDAMVDMGHRFHAGTVYSGLMAESPDQMRKVATAFVSDSDKVALLAVIDGHIVGMLLALLHTHFLSGERMAGEVAWWVEPEARGTIGLRLLVAAERWARDRGATKIQMVAPTANVERIYKARKYEKVETTYQRSL